MHIFMGVFNKLYKVCKDKLVQLFDEPYMSRSEEAGQMRGRVAELDQKQREQAAMVQALQEQLEQLKK